MSFFIRHHHSWKNAINKPLAYRARNLRAALPLACRSQLEWTSHDSSTAGGSVWRTTAARITIITVDVNQP
jgi:hypothetical protein